MSRFTNEDRQIMTRVAMRLFQKWGVGDDDARAILGGIDEATYRRWKAGPIGRIPRSIEPRLSALVGIHWGLRMMFSEPRRGYAWMSRPNAIFNHSSPLQSVAGGDLNALIRLRDYLTAQSQPW